MATITLSADNVSFGGVGSEGLVSYSTEDINLVLGQGGAEGLQPVDAVINVAMTPDPPASLPIPAGQHVTILIAVNEEGEQLRGETHRGALPCPIYCGKFS